MSFNQQRLMLNQASQNSVSQKYKRQDLSKSAVQTRNRAFSQNHTADEEEASSELIEETTLNSHRDPAAAEDTYYDDLNEDSPSRGTA